MFNHLVFVLSVREMLIIILKQHITEINTNNCPQTFNHNKKCCFRINENLLIIKLTTFECSGHLMINICILKVKVKLLYIQLLFLAHFLFSKVKVRKPCADKKCQEDKTTLEQTSVMQGLC